MLATITLLTALAFAVLYPLCFWISFKDPLKDGFHKFHIGLPNTVGGTVVVFIWFMDIPLSLKILVTFWKAVFLSVSSYSWKKSFPSPKLLSIPCFIGVYAFIRLQSHLIDPSWQVSFIGLLGGLIYCAALFAMNLGHWYLNVHGLPMKHLIRSVDVFWFFIVLRAVWDVLIMCSGKILYNGDLISLIHFVSRFDGFLLWVGLFFGTIFPLISLYFAKEVLKLKNTQSATGILYVILCSVLLGDIAYKYYLTKYGIFL